MEKVIKTKSRKKVRLMPDDQLSQHFDKMTRIEGNVLIEFVDKLLKDGKEVRGEILWNS